MQYSLEKIAALTGAQRFGRTEAQIDRLLTDSRSLAFPETTLFFALRTRKGDGHQYIPDLYRRGVRSFVVATLPADYAVQFPEAAFLRVLSPLKALQRLAERHREEYELPVVGITGSNGKTLVKEWLYQVLSPTMHVTRSPRSYNSQVGVPLSVWLLDERSQAAVFEAGISQPGEMAALRAIVQPTVGIMTNIGQAHQENFSSIEEKCMEKLSLFADTAALVYDADDAVVAQGVEAMGYRGKRLCWSRQQASVYLYVKQVAEVEGGLRLTYVWRGRTCTANLPFRDEASLQNACHCLTAALYLGLTPDEVGERLSRLEPIAMRLEVRRGVRGCVLINDSYNSDVNSLDIALDFLHRRSESAGGTGRVLILSDILQSGVEPAELYDRVAQMVAARGVEQLIGVGPAITAEGRRFSIPSHFFPTTEALMESGLLATLRGSTVLLKGARGFGFEQISSQLSERVHETTLEVNLEALAANLDYYRSFMQPATRMVCMVKASGYGVGSVEIAKTLQERGVDYLAVAVADEGVELRRAGITAGILIMNPEMSTLSTLFEYHLEPEVYSFALLEALIRAAGREGVTGFPIHIKLDTGMHRLGFDPRRDMPVLIDRLLHQNGLSVRSVFSHFVGSDSPDFDAFSRQQYRLFREGADQLTAAFPHHILRHICNSAGIERFPERHLDMVRLGLGLYGIDPIDERALHPVATLRTTILQIHDVPAGDSVGYSRRTVLDRPSRIAAIPIGYADGLDRRLGNRVGYCLVGGRRAPYVGNICMDVSMIDVTDIPCSEGDSVEIFGEHLPVTEISRLLGTIPYEVLTGVSDRVKRVYYQG